METLNPVNPTPAWIALQGAANARAVVPGVLLRSDNLQSLTSADVRVLLEQHALETVLDLRTDVEVQLEGPGPMTAEPQVRIEYRSLHPDSGGNTDLDLETINPWRRFRADEVEDESPIVRAYLSYLSRRPDSIVGSIRTIARAQGAVLVHCAAGKDRTGVVVAMALAAAGVDREAIVADYLASSERIELIMARLLASDTYRSDLEGHDAQQHAPIPGTIERFFEVVDDRFAGPVQWLLEYGLEPSDLERLRLRLAPFAGSGENGALAGAGDNGLEPGELGAQLADQHRLS
jgi:protein-tyrosine phosphatase